MHLEARPLVFGQSGYIVILEIGILTSESCLVLLHLSDGHDLAAI